MAKNSVQGDVGRTRPNGDGFLVLEENNEFVVSNVARICRTRNAERLDKLRLDRRFVFLLRTLRIVLRIVNDLDIGTVNVRPVKGVEHFGILKFASASRCLSECR